MDCLGERKGTMNTQPTTITEEMETEVKRIYGNATSGLDLESQSTTSTLTPGLCFPPIRSLAHIHKLQAPF